MSRGLCHLLHDFTVQTQYEIIGYNSVATPAQGQGYAHVRNPIDSSHERIFFVYTPTVTGTIISLENHARMHPRIHRWAKEAVPSLDKGWITFYNSTDEVVSCYQTERINGLYYIQDLTFLPVSSDCIATSITTMLHLAAAPSPATTLPMEIAPDDATVPIANVDLHSPSDFCPDFNVGLSLPSYIAAIQASTVLHPDPVVQQLRPVPHLSTTEKDIVLYYTWHQRLAHCSEEKLWQPHIETC